MALVDQKNAGMPLYSDLTHEIYTVLFHKSAGNRGELDRPEAGAEGRCNTCPTYTAGRP